MNQTTHAVFIINVMNVLVIKMKINSEFVMLAFLAILLIIVLGIEKYGGI